MKNFLKFVCVFLSLFVFCAFSVSAEGTINASEQAILEKIQMVYTVGDREYTVPTEYVNQARNFFLTVSVTEAQSDEIIGYITKGRGVSVHRRDCVNINDLFSEENRMIDVYWFDDVNGSYKVEIEILANDRNGLLKDIIKQVENSKIKLTGMNTRTTREGIAIIDISLEVENTSILNKVLSSFRNVESVYDVNRKRG